MLEDGARRELIENLRSRLDAVREVRGKLREALQHPAVAEDPPPAFMQWGIATYFHDFYSAVEDLAYHVSHDINGEVPWGERGHRALLDRVLAEVPGKRRALFSASIAGDLEELRRFHHFFRHKYGKHPEWPKLREHAERIRRIAPQVEQDVEQFIAWMESGGPP